MTVFAYTMAFLGSLVAIIFWANAILIIRPLRWPSIEGKITSSGIREWNHQGGEADETQVKVGTAYAPEISYGYRVGHYYYESDRIFSGGVIDYDLGKFHSHKIIKKYYPGKIVKIYYDPNNPRISFLEPGFRISQKFFIFLFAGVFFFASLIADFVLGLEIINRAIFIILAFLGAAIGYFFFHISSKGEEGSNRDYEEDYWENYFDEEDQDKRSKDMEAWPAWQRLHGEENKQSYTELESLFGSSEPTPEITYRVAEIYVNSEENLQKCILHWFQHLFQENDWVYALEWEPVYKYQYGKGRFQKSYKFYPHHPFSSSHPGDWPIKLIHGKHYAFFQRQGKSGAYYDAEQETMCIFGEKLLEEVNKEKPVLFREEVRIDGIDLY